MVYRGQVKNGVVVLDGAKRLADGTTVSVRTLKTKTKKSKAKSGKSVPRDSLRKHAGKVGDLPVDAARNVDHYLYGRPKR